MFIDRLQIENRAIAKLQFDRTARGTEPLWALLRVVRVMTKFECGLMIPRGGVWVKACLLETTTLGVAASVCEAGEGLKVSCEVSELARGRIDL